MTITTVPDEETPLLGRQQAATLTSLSNPTPSINGETKRDAAKRTPLPWAQFSITLFLQLAEPLISQVISPFVPELIRSLDVAKNEAEVGYYVGIIQSSFFAAQACTVLHWSGLSDHIGRKPVVLIGLFGLALSMYCFAFSKTFWGFLLSRALTGALNADVGVIKSIIADMTDHTNLALAYSYQPISWSAGTTLGPMIGGALSRPAERFPDVFGNSKFLKEYPYFLPCVVPATFTVVAWLVTFFFLKETHPSPKPIQEFLRGEKKRIGSEEDPLLTPPQNQFEKPVSMRNLLTRDVIIASASYAFLALIDVSFRSLHPLFLSTPIALGGLGLDPPAIGTVMSFYGILNGIFTIFFFSRMTDCFGVKRVYLTGVAAGVPCFSLFPIINCLARNSMESSGKLGLQVWIAVGLQVVMATLVFLSYGSVFIFIAAASPNKASLGATNGLAQLSAAAMRTIGPALASSMYSLSIDQDHHYMGGRLVYYATVTLSLGTICVGTLLPRHPWKDTN